MIQCPTPSQYYQIPKAPKFVISSDSITIIIKDLLNLHTLLLEVKKDMIITKSESDDILFNILTNFSNPDASHFTSIKFLKDDLLYLNIQNTLHFCFLC